jgi:hypothetical protein
MNSEIKYNTTKLYSLLPARGFWSGFSSILSIFGEPRKFNYSQSSAEADRKALASDWATIGRDFITVINSTFAS